MEPVVDQPWSGGDQQNPSSDCSASVKTVAGDRIGKRLAAELGK
jgi:hypothetical protein